MELRDEIAHIIGYNCFPSVYDKDDAHWYHKLADSILALIESQRCEWTVTKRGYWRSGHDGKIMSDPFDLTDMPYCPICGKRVEVKDEG